MTWKKLDGLFESNGMMRKPTPEELAKHDADTRRHIEQVAMFLGWVITALRYRSVEHDESKFSDVERNAYAVVIPQLAGMKYGTPEHKAVLAQMKPAIAHHQAANRHHPEYHRNGVKGMDIIDLVEMAADWKAASLREGSGTTFEEGVKISAKRFGLSEDLTSVILNTAKLFEEGP